MGKLLVSQVYCFFLSIMNLNTPEFMRFLKEIVHQLTENSPTARLEFCQERCHWKANTYHEDQGNVYNYPSEFK